MLCVLAEHNPRTSVDF